MKLKNYLLLTIVITLFTASNRVVAMFPINVSRAFDPHLRPPRWDGAKFQLSSWAEGGFFERGVNGNNSDVNVLQIWQPNQNAIAMLKGFSDTSPITQKLTAIEQLAQSVNLDDDTRGHFTVTGDFKYKAGGGLTARYYLPYNFSLAAYTAFYSMELKNVTFVDNTANVTTADIAVHELLTDDFINNIAAFDKNLNLLGGWKKAGAGDLIFMAEWARNFAQAKPILRNVVLHAHAGAFVPTSLKKDADEILSVNFGFDGSSGIIVGGGIGVNWFNLFNGGCEIEIIQPFGNTRERRIKVDPAQTEFLFLAKAPAHKDFGLTQRYNLFLEADKFWRGFGFGTAYQYWRHGEDTISLGTLDFSNDIANSAESLQGWTIHQMVITLSYNFYNDFSDDTTLKPHLRLFYKFPFNGQRAILTHTAGAVLTINF